MPILPTQENQPFLHPKFAMMHGPMLLGYGHRIQAFAVLTRYTKIMAYDNGI